MQKPIRTSNSSKRQTASTLAGLVVFAFCSAALGQAGSKESQKFVGYSEDSRETIAEARKELETALTHYNALLSGDERKPKSVYKKFNKALGRTEKLAGKTRDLVKKMESQAKRVFRNWQKELDGYENESLRQLGAKRFEVMRNRYEVMIDRMRAAGEAYDPLIASLHDQDLFMSRDLSPEALANLAPMGADVNRLADLLYVRIATVLEEELNDEVVVTEGSAAKVKN